MPGNPSAFAGTECSHHHRGHRGEPSQCRHVTLSCGALQTESGARQPGLNLVSPRVPRSTA